MSSPNAGTTSYIVGATPGSADDDPHDLGLVYAVAIAQEGQ